MSTAPHQSRKKRELTRAVETLKIVYGGDRDRLTIFLSNPIFSSTLPSMYCYSLT